MKYKQDYRDKSFHEAIGNLYHDGLQPYRVRDNMQHSEFRIVDLNNFSYADSEFINTEFAGYIRSSKFYRCVFVGCTFTGIIMLDSTFNECVFRGCSFEGALLINTKLIDPKFNSLCKFDGCQSTDYRFLQANGPVETRIIYIPELDILVFGDGQTPMPEDSIVLDLADTDYGYDNIRDAYPLLDFEVSRYTHEQRMELLNESLRYLRRLSEITATKHRTLKLRPQLLDCTEPFISVRVNI